MDVLLAGFGMFGRMKFLGKHEVTLLRPANEVLLDTVHGFVIHLAVSSAIQAKRLAHIPIHWFLPVLNG